MNRTCFQKAITSSVLCFLSLSLPVLAQEKANPSGASRGAQTLQHGQQLPIQFHTLSNGLEVVTSEDTHVPVVNVQVWYHVGSKDEKSGHTGFAHLFEHLMFKGSAHVGPDEHSRIIEAMGGFDNAYTNDDVTVFYETFPSNYLERVLWLEADRMGSLNVDQKNFESERQVVEEEHRLRVDNSPYGRVQQDLYAAAFTVHPYHHTTIGSMADLDKATVEQVRAFHDIYYRPNNATLVIVGNFRPAEALAWAQKYFGGIPRSPQPIPRVAVKEPPQTDERTVTKEYPGVPLPAVVEGYKMPAKFTPDSYPLDLASNILAGGESSLLYRSLVYQQQIALEAEGFGNFTEDPNLFWVLAVMNPPHTAEEGEKALDAVLAQIKDQPVSVQELQKAKNQQISAFILGRETDEERASALGEAAVLGKNPNLVNSDLSRYEEVTAAQIKSVADEYFIPARETVLFYLPLKQPQSGQSGPSGSQQ
ncbi:MAG TPA: pitrilysin family protein [Candidatus Acidoferrales bacterium]|nr:pitrilysin family protein [Candidatus Acidoferrales bacterium]